MKMYNVREGILFHIFLVLILFKNNFLFVIAYSTSDVCFGCYMIIRSFQFIGQMKKISDQVCIWLLFEKSFEPLNLVYPGLSCFDLMMYVPIHAKEK